MRVLESPLQDMLHRPSRSEWWWACLQVVIQKRMRPEPDAIARWADDGGR